MKTNINLTIKEVSSDGKCAVISLGELINEVNGIDDEELREYWIQSISQKMDAKVITPNQ